MIDYLRTALIVAGVTAACCGCGSEPTSQPAEPADQSTARVVMIAAKDIVQQVEVPATIEGQAMTDISPRVMAYVARMHVDIGDEVEEGQPLVTLSAPEFLAEVHRHQEMVIKAEREYESQLAQLASAEATVQQAHAQRAEQDALLKLRESEHQRQAQLVSSGAVSQARQQEAAFQLQAAQASIARVDADLAHAEAERMKSNTMLESARAEIQVAQAGLRAAQTMADYLSIHAPYAGVITERHVDNGALVRPPNEGGSALLRIESVDSVRLILFLPLEQAGELDTSDLVKLRDVPSARSREFPPATISRFAKSFARGSRMMRAEADMQNLADEDGHRMLKPGDYGKADLTLRTFEAGLTVPLTAIGENLDGPFLMTVDGNLVCRRAAVAVLYQTPDEAVVEGMSVDLKAGQRIVASEPASYRDGQQLDSIENTAR